MRFLILVAVCFVGTVRCQAGHEPEDNEFAWEKFPDGFLFGSATSSYQVEGAWDVQGKGLNIWDTFSHTSEGGSHVNNDDTGDIACNSYYKFEEDVRMIKELGSHFYRFSISWARLMPDGTKDNINQAGINYYNMLINALLAEGIIPMVTLYHWDLPQHLQDFGGWHNESMIGYFTDYADLCYKEFGDRVKHWMTFNEPWVVTWLGYGVAAMAPGLYDPAEGQYKTAHVIIKAHAEAWHLYDDTYRPTQQGECGIVLNSDYAEPQDPSSQADVDAADRDLQFALGWFAHPVFINGDYPEIMKTKIATKSASQGYPKSRLPEFTPAEKARIAKTSDFFGLNHYSTHYTFDAPNPASEANFDADKDTGGASDPSWPGSGSDWLQVVPWGIRKLLNWIKKEYDNPKVYITENGVSDKTGILNDQLRVDYYKGYMNNVLKAAKRDGCDVQAYTAWSLMDNYEWGAGYSERFGMHYVDFNDPARPRLQKDSAKYFAQVIKDHGFVDYSEQNADTAASVQLSLLTIVLALLVSLYQLN